MSHPKYDEDGLRLDPLPIRQYENKSVNHPDMWMYEEKNGLTVVCYAGGTKTMMGHIPARRLREWNRIVPAEGAPDDQ